MKGNKVFDILWIDSHFFWQLTINWCFACYLFRSIPHPPLPHLKCDSVYQLWLVARLVELNCGEKETDGSIVNLIIASDQKILIKPNA